MDPTYVEIEKMLIQLANPERAEKMASYMRNRFSFLGIPATDRRKSCQSLLRQSKKEGKIDWSLVEKLYAKEEREYQYVALDYLTALKKTLLPEDLQTIRSLIEIKSWWDSVDLLAGLVGEIVRKDEKLKKTMLEWAEDENFWIRRTAILHQNKYKTDTDLSLLTDILVMNQGSDEFFINKAIGWALREYSKTNSVWVQQFCEKYREQLSALSFREALRYLKTHHLFLTQEHSESKSGESL